MLVLTSLFEELFYTTNVLIPSASIVSTSVFIHISKCGGVTYMSIIALFSLSSFFFHELGFWASWFYNSVLFFYYGFYLFIFFFIHCCTVYDTGYVVCMGANDHIVLSGVCLLWTDQNVSDLLWIFFLFNNNWYHIHLELDYYIKQPLPCLSRRELHLLFLLPPPLEICTLLLR